MSAIDKELKPHDQKMTRRIGTVVVVGAVLALLFTNGSIGNKLVSALIGAIITPLSFYMVGVGGLRTLLAEATLDDLPEEGTPERDAAAKRMLVAMVVVILMLVGVIVVSSFLFWNQTGVLNIVLPILGAVYGLISYWRSVMA